MALCAVGVLATLVASRARIDHVTKVPAMTSPPAASTISGPIPVSFTLPEAARPGSVVLVLARTGGDTSVVALADANGSGTHTVSVDPDNLSALGTVGGPTRLEDGRYSVRVRYADTAQNPAVSSDMRTFTLARATIPGPTAAQPHLRVRWTVAGGTLRANFTALAAAQGYQLFLQAGGSATQGTCTTADGGVRCSVGLGNATGWSATVLAQAGGRTIATAGRARETH